MLKQQGIGRPQRFSNYRFEEPALEGLNAPTTQPSNKGIRKASTFNDSPAGATLGVANSMEQGLSAIERKKLH